MNALIARLLVFPLMTLMTSMTSLAAASTPLTLAEAVDRAVGHNAGLRAVHGTTEAAAAGVELSRSALLPRLDGTVGAIYTDHPVQVFGLKLLQNDLSGGDMGLGALKDPAARADVTARLDLQVPVLDVSSWYVLDAAARGADAASAGERAAVAQLVVQVVSIYHGVQLAEARQSVAHDAVESARADVSRARAQAGTGMATEADVLGLAAALAGLEEAALVASGDATVARAELARLLDEADASGYTLTTPLDAPPPAVNTAADPRANHPELLRADAGLAAATAAQHSAAASYLPTVGLSASLEGHRESLEDAGGRAWMVGGFLRVNLFAGLGDAARHDAAEAEVRRAEAQRDDAHRSLDVALRRARLAVGQAEERTRVSTEAVTHAREAHRLIRTRFENGMAQSADVLRTQIAFLEAETHHLAALYARHVAAVQLAAATGELDATYLSPHGSMSK